MVNKYTREEQKYILILLRDYLYSNFLNVQIWQLITKLQGQIISLFKKQM